MKSERQQLIILLTLDIKYIWHSTVYEAHNMWLKSKIVVLRNGEWINFNILWALALRFTVAWIFEYQLTGYENGASALALRLRLRLKMYPQKCMLIYFLESYTENTLILLLEQMVLFKVTSGTELGTNFVNVLLMNEYDVINESCIRLFGN